MVTVWLLFVVWFVNGSFVQTPIYGFGEHGKWINAGMACEEKLLSIGTPPSSLNLLCVASKEVPI